MKGRIAIVLLLASLAAPLAAHAQQTAAPEPVVRTTIDPPRVAVGQPATLRLDVLAPNYMTAPPELPSFQLRNAVTRASNGVNINEQQNGVDYAGVRFEFAIYPLEPGAFAVTGQKLTIKYAAEPPATREAVIALPRIEFQAFIPDAAAALHPYLAANGLSVEQAVQRSSDSLKTGDAVTRIVTIKAEGAPAMLLPPMSFAGIDGLAVYPAQPSLQDKTDSRTDVLTSTRVDSATYMLEKAGDYVLPAIDLDWWNAAENKIETAHLDAIKLQVAANPAASALPATGSGTRWRLRDLLDLVADHWLLMLLAAVALAALGLITPHATRWILARHRERHDAYLRSESFSFEQLRRAARSRDAKSMYFALLEWLQRFEPVAPSHTVRSFTTAARDAALDHDISAIEHELFTSNRGAAVWSAHRLMRSISGARRRLQSHHARAARSDLPQHLNPVDDRTLSARRRRIPAR
jgi:hypothetical protein